MVLEELKKAESLIELLRNSGYKAPPGGKPLKAEYIDQEFGDKHYASTLTALLAHLDTVTLSSREIAKYAMPLTVFII